MENPPTPKRVRTRPRTQIACLACKSRKQKCEPIGTGCRNCIRAGRDCIIEDPATKIRQPRGYLQSLEERVGMLEGLLAQTYPDLSNNHLHEFENKSSDMSNDQNDSGDMADVMSDFERNQSNQFSSTTSFIPEIMMDTPFTSVTSGDHINTPSVVNHPESMDELSSEIGMLSLQAAGQSPPHYFGPGSSFLFSKTVFSHLNRLRSQGPGLSLGGVWDWKMSSLPPAVPAALPSREIGRLLSNAYFENINPQVSRPLSTSNILITLIGPAMESPSRPSPADADLLLTREKYPILHRPTFNKWEQQVMDARDNATIPHSVASFFVNIVYAVGTLILPHTIDSPAECFYAAAETHLGLLAQAQGLDLVQAILCFAMYSMRNAIGISVWNLSGLALRQCVELGYHRNTRKFRTDQNPILQQLQRRVFWVAYDLDRCACVTLGRPFGIADSDIDVDLPFDVNDEAITSHTLTAVPRTNPTDTPTTMSAFLHLTQLRRIWSRMQTDLYPINPSLNNEATMESRIIKFREELDHWHQTIPPPTPVFAALSTFSTSEWFHLAYNHSKLLLYRRMLAPGAHGGLSTPYLECCTAAREICLLYRKLFLANPVSYTWGALHILFLAGLTYLHCLVSCPEVRRVSRQDDIAHTSTSCTIVLVIMAERWKAVAAYRDTFEMLAKATMSMLVNAAYNASGEMINVQQVGCEAPRVQSGSLMGLLTNQQGLTELPGYIEDIERVGMCFGTEELLTQFLAER